MAKQFVRRLIFWDWNQNIERKLLLFKMIPLHCVAYPSWARFHAHMRDCTYTTSRDFLQAKVDNETNAFFS